MRNLLIAILLLAAGRCFGTQIVGTFDARSSNALVTVADASNNNSPPTLLQLITIVAGATNNALTLNTVSNNFATLAGYTLISNSIVYVSNTVVLVSNEVVAISNLVILANANILTVSNRVNLVSNQVVTVSNNAVTASNLAAAADNHAGTGSNIAVTASNLAASKTTLTNTFADLTNVTFEGLAVARNDVLLNPYTIPASSWAIEFGTLADTGRLYHIATRHTLNFATNASGFAGTYFLTNLELGDPIATNGPWIVTSSASVVVTAGIVNASTGTRVTNTVGKGFANIKVWAVNVSGNPIAYLSNLTTAVSDELNYSGVAEGRTNMTLTVPWSSGDAVIAVTNSTGVGAASGVDKFWAIY